MQYYLQKYWTSAAVAVGCVCVAYHLGRRKNKCKPENEFDYLQINIIKTKSSCDEVVAELLRRCSEHRALGFDCEWVTEKGKRNPIALLQLSSIDGYCGLFRLNCLKTIPKSLKNLLEDESVFKMGVAAIDDAGHLLNDYSVLLRSTLDLRHIAKLFGLEPGGLAAMANSVLGVSLDKCWKIRCSDWEANRLTHKQIQYAALDAHVAIKIFVYMYNRHNNSFLSWLTGSRGNVAENVQNICTKYANVRFKPQLKQQDFAAKESRSKKTVAAKRPYPNAARSKPLYHNCFMHAPDGELLCTCDDKKALWYVEKGLADIVNDSPLTVRLRFEPAGRCVGEVGRYYQLVKENKCVVCSSDKFCIRKNVVPREYRRYFPEIMKDHSSHDVVLLCPECHRTSNMNDQALRTSLSIVCAAPLPAFQHMPTWEDPVTKKIRSAARALLYQSQRHVLPERRKKELEDLLLQHYPEHSEITDELLHEAVNVQIVVENESYESHGMRVVEYYKKRAGGLLRLEELWREHFLDNMQPKHLPELWSVTHNEERLRVKFNEGRLSEEDLRLMGVSWTQECRTEGQSVLQNGHLPEDE